MKIIKKTDRTYRIYMVFLVIVSMVLHNSLVPVAYVYAADADSSDTSLEESDKDDGGDDEGVEEDESDEEDEESDGEESEDEEQENEEDEDAEEDNDNDEDESDEDEESDGDEQEDEEDGDQESEDGQKNTDSVDVSDSNNSESVPGETEEKGSEADQSDTEDFSVSESEETETTSEQSTSGENDSLQSDELSDENEQSNSVEEVVNEEKDPGIDSVAAAEKEDNTKKTIGGEMTMVVEQTNSAEIQNDVQSSADTGANTADRNGVSENDGEEITDGAGQNEEEVNNSEENESDDTDEQGATLIETGDALSLVNIINTVNTNIYGENWLELVYDLDGVHEEDINLFQQYLTLIENRKVDDGGGGSVTIENTNTAEIVNAVEVDANTGNNSASENEGDATIDTGDAIAGANIVNNVNNNLVGNNWLFATINVFGLWTGDLIVPGEGLLDAGTSSQFDHVEIENTNTAEIVNAVEVDANTGENSASDNGSESSVITGESVASADVIDVVNTNIVADNWFFLLINDLGSWTGNIVHHDQERGIYQSLYQYTFGDSEQIISENSRSQCINCSSLTIKNTNSATITNDVSVHANTGGNTANENTGDTSIATGDAHAWTNIVNFVNNNIVGNNWMFGVVNVLGEWRGDTVFAYPDLSISVDDGKKEVMSGDALVYEVTYTNDGEAAAEGVEVLVELSGRMHSGDTLTHNVGTLAPGESATIRINATVDDVESQSAVEAFAGIRTSTEERELGNNSASDSTNVLVPGIGGNELYVEYYDKGNEWEYDPDLEITRTSSSSSNVRFGEVVKHEIIVENTGDGPIYDIVLFDAIANSAGTTMEEYGWIIGSLDEDEAVMVEYEIIFNGLLNEKNFNFEAVAYGYDIFDDEVDSNKESLAFNMIGSLQRYAYNVVTGDENIFPQLIPEAQAATIEPMKPAEITRNDGIWLWLISLLLYSLVINWTLYPRKVN